MRSPSPDRPVPGRRAASFAAASIALAAGLAPRAFAGDPFAPGLRWTRATPGSESWIPKSVAFGAGDELVWFAAGGPEAHLEVCSTPGSGAAAPLARDDGLAGTSGALGVAAGDANDAFYSLAQEPTPDLVHRKTVLARHAPIAAAQGLPFLPVWEHEIGPPTNGTARLACSSDGALVAAAAWIDGTGTVELRWHAGESGAALAQASFAAPRLDELALSADGALLAVAAGPVLRVFDAQGAQVDALPLAVACGALAISGDGSELAFAAGDRVRACVRGPAGYAVAFEALAPTGEVAIEVALSRDARTLAIGWWQASGGAGLRYELWDVPAQTRIFELAQRAGPGGLQNLPAAIAIDPAGARIAFGGWGDGAAAPEAVLVDRASASVVLAIDLPGSVTSLALDASGTRVAVAHKSAHANTASSGGAVRLYDTGEHDLAALGQARAGLALPLAAKKAGASHCLFLLGAASDVPARYPGTFGELWLQRPTIQVFARPCDADGRADLDLRLAPDPATIGTELHLQAAFRVGGALHFGTTRIDPLVL